MECGKAEDLQFALVKVKRSRVNLAKRRARVSRKTKPFFALLDRSVESSLTVFGSVYRKLNKLLRSLGTRATLKPQLRSMQTRLSLPPFNLPILPIRPRNVKGVHWKNQRLLQRRSGSKLLLQLLLLDQSRRLKEDLLNLNGEWCLPSALIRDEADVFLLGLNQ